MRIYNEGAFTEPIAHVNLTSPLTQVLMIGDKVVGSSEGYTREIRGSIIDNYPKGTRAIRVKYDENEIQSSFVGCQVAANPNPKFTGCKSFGVCVLGGRSSSIPTHSCIHSQGFASDGLLTVSGYTRSISYNYNQSSDNLSQKSIARFSTEARLNMELCEGCPYNDYIKFRDYYGSGNYADLWIRSAYEGKQTIFSHGNADFSTYGHAGKFGKFIIECQDICYIDLSWKHF